MLRKTGRKSLLKGIYVLGAANIIGLGGLALAVFAEAPALASAGADDFELAFAPIEMKKKEAEPTPSQIFAAEQRFAAAPVEEIEPAEAEPFASGNASYYGKAFAGRRTASGETFNPAELTAAHRTLPFGTLVRVTNPSNGDSVVVRINDRGPFHGNRIIDLSREAARQIGLVQTGHGRVQLARLSS